MCTNCYNIAKVSKIKDIGRYIIYVHVNCKHAIDEGQVIKENLNKKACKQLIASRMIHMLVLACPTSAVRLQR